MGNTQVQFTNRRASFGKIPVNLGTTKSFYLTNTGTTHAYYQVMETDPIPGMLITPKYGVVPVGGVCPLKIEMHPKEIIKFDARILVQIRGSKTLELRLGGESEEPYVDIDVVSVYSV